MKLRCEGKWHAEIERHFCAFLDQMPSEAAPELTVVETSRAPRKKGCQTIGGLSPEVVIRLSEGTPPVAFASNKVTTRSILRLAKRYPDISTWRRSRWLLFLRHALEFPLLSILENRHGYIPIHASTVVGPSGATLILGDNGAGKSTLACWAVDELGLALGSDNFSPCDGVSVLGFPGVPKPKPGRALPEHRPVGMTVPVKAVIGMGFDLTGKPSRRASSLLQYLAHNGEAHRATGWALAFGGDWQKSAATDARVADLLARLPSTSYNWSSDTTNGIKEFMAENCA
jgi:hypothetical protein